MDAAGMSRGEDVRTRSLAETGGKERVRLFLEGNDALMLPMVQVRGLIHFLPLASGIPRSDSVLI